MKTNDLINMLAVNAGPMEPAASRRFLFMLGWGGFGAALLMAMLLGVREDLAAASLLPMFWLKLAFPVSLAVAAFFAADRLARPGAALGRVPAALLAPVAVIWLIGAATLLGAPAGDREALLFGETWQDCPLFIVVLSLPVMAGSFWAMRGLAPTRLPLAGAAAGLLAGAVGAAVYSLHCPEMAAPFLGTWYLLGMLIPATAGALLAPLLLRW